MTLYPNAALFYTDASIQRIHGQMDTAHRRSSPSPLFVRQHSPTPDHPSSPPVSRLALPPLRSHYPRDGYDYRRPFPSARISASSNNAVIDLTQDDEPVAPSNQPEPTAASSAMPRFGREIIDLSDDTSPVQPARSARTTRPSSPEVLFVSSRPRSRTEQHNHPPPFLNPDMDHRADLTLDQDDDLIVEGSRTGVNLLAPLGAQRRHGSDIGRLAQLVFEAGGRYLGNAARIVRPGAGAGAGPGHMPTFFGAAEDANPHHPLAHQRARIVAGLPLPGFMGFNYETVGFDLGIGDEVPQQTMPKFDPPPPAPKGFTRDPTEEDTIICPNCEEELAVGEDEEKRQVWVVKACGHVSQTIPNIAPFKPLLTSFPGLLRHMHE
jgi:hypothetical protein